MFIQLVMINPIVCLFAIHFRKNKKTRYINIDNINRMKKNYDIVDTVLPFFNIRLDFPKKYLGTVKCPGFLFFIKFNGSS